MSLVTDNRDFINKHGGNAQTKAHVKDLYDNMNFKMYQIYPKLIRTGNLFTFQYYDKTLPYELSKRQIPYADLHPFGIILSTTDGKIRMLNLNVVPMRVRERIFAVIDRIHHHMLSRNSMNDNPNSWLRIPITEEFLKKYIPYDLGIAINIYNIKYMRKIDAISWANLPSIMSLYFKKTIYYNRGSSISQHIIDMKIILNKRNEKILK